MCGSIMTPCSPMKIEPALASFLPAGICAKARSGRRPPSYQVTLMVSPLVNSVPLKTHSMVCSRHQVCGLAPTLSALTLRGLPSFSAVKTGSSRWQPKSPMVPLPKSTQSRHLNGW